jgi:hypothetical protein
MLRGAFTLLIKFSTYQKKTNRVERRLSKYSCQFWFFE